MTYTVDDSACTRTIINTDKTHQVRRTVQQTHTTVNTDTQFCASAVNTRAHSLVSLINDAFLQTNIRKGSLESDAIIMQAVQGPFQWVNILECRPFSIHFSSQKANLGQFIPNFYTYYTERKEEKFKKRKGRDRDSFCHKIKK